MRGWAARKGSRQLWIPPSTFSRSPACEAAFPQVLEVSIQSNFKHSELTARASRNGAVSTENRNALSEIKRRVGESALLSARPCLIILFVFHLFYFPFSAIYKLMLENNWLLHPNSLARADTVVNVLDLWPFDLFIWKCIFTSKLPSRTFCWLMTFYVV